MAEPPTYKRRPEYLSGSAVQPSKSRAIEGVNATSFIALQSAVFARQESAAARGEGAEPVARPRRLQTKDGLGAANAGVAQREARDASDVRSRGAEAVGERLAEKAAMYEQLSRGGQPYDEDAYNVDFVLKPGGGGRGGGGREEEEEAREDARRSEARRVVGELAAETAEGRERAARAAAQRTQAEAAARRQLIKETAAKLRAAEKAARAAKPG